MAASLRPSLGIPGNPLSTAWPGPLARCRGLRGLAASMAVMVLSVAFYGSLTLYSDSHGQFGKVGRRQTGPKEAGLGFHGLEVCCKQSREEPASALLC